MESLPTGLPEGAVVKHISIGHTCEAGLFDPSFACDEVDTERCQVSNTVVRLCAEHQNVITIKPTAEA